MNTTITRVRLRNGLLANVWLLHPYGVVEPFHLMGIDAEDCHHLWSLDGRWHEHGRPHLFDIVSHSFQPPELDNGTFDGSAP